MTVSTCDRVWIDYDQTVPRAHTPLAQLYEIGGERVWVPFSVTHQVDKDQRELLVEEWWAIHNGIEGRRDR